MLPNNPARVSPLLAMGVAMLLAWPAVGALAAEIDANRLLEQADAVRFPRESFETEITVSNFSGTKPGDEFKFQVMSRGNENTIVLTTSPASDRGQAMLMRGRDLWVFMPSVSQPVRLSLSQRLTGQVANGDLARANFASDYHPKLLRTETIDNETYNVLELIAVDRSVTYQKVVYWVRQKDNWPFKAEFYSLSNRLLKVCKYENFQTMEGRPRPTRLVMEDALKAGNVSVLEYNSMKLRDLPDKIFTKDYLKKLD